MPMETESRIRNRIPKSCRRCHRRKQKCVGFPTCSNCQSAGQHCSRSESSPSWHHAMSKGALVRRIESLEAQLATALKGNASVAQKEGEQLDTTATESHGQNTKRNHHLHGVVRFLTLGHDSNEEQSYLGPSSGVSLVENVKKMVHYAGEGKLLPVTPGNRPQEPFLPDTSDEVMAPPPDDETGAQIIDAYFKNTHTRLPFLDDSEILDLHAKRHQPIGISPEEQFGRFKLYMVYAVGSEVVQMSGTYESTPPRAFLTTALRFDPSFRESISIASIEAMMLLVVHTLFSTSNSSVWYMIGLAMRTCIDFGLHRESRYQKWNPKEAESHRRLFWCVYIIERYTAWSLGRPFSIPEEEIDVEPPSNINVSVNTDQILEINDQTQPNLQPHPQKPKLGRFIASIRLQRIVSDIHTRIFRIDRPAISLLPEITTLMSTLQNFKETLPPLDLADDDFVHMHWNNAIRIVLQPFLGLLHPEDKLISTSLNASGQMCQLFKRIRHRDSTIHSFLLVNSIFAAGLTMCFCLFRCPSLWSPTVSNDIRACSSSLSVMAERNTKLKKYRDGLENVINRTMEFVENAYETSKLNNSIGIHSQLNMGPNGSLHTSSIADSLPHIQQPIQPLQESEAQQLEADLHHFQNTNIFSDMPGFSPDLQDLFNSDNVHALDAFHSIFADDFWGIDNFNK